MVSRLRTIALVAAGFGTLCSACTDDAPEGLRRTPDGPGATVRFDLGHRPLPDIPLPNDTATWPDPTSRTGLRINASLVASTELERQARERFSDLEGWGTYGAITVGFDVDRSAKEYADYEGAALDLANVAARHRGDDYDFANDAVYLVNLETGVPVPIDLGARSFDYTLKNLGAYWANDPRATERNLLFDTRDELATANGSISPAAWGPKYDTDFDGVLDRPNLDDPAACPAPDLARCDDPGNADYGGDECLAKRRSRDRCIADHLLTYYERETDTLIIRPLVPLDEMARYAVVLTDRLVDGKGHAVKSPFEYVYHATQEQAAQRVMDAINDPAKKKYFGDGPDGIAGTGLDHVAFVWSFTTQPTFDDMKRLRDGLYGRGPFAQLAETFPPAFELGRAVGLVSGLDSGEKDEPGWQTSPSGMKAGCPTAAKNLYVLPYSVLRPHMRDVVTKGFGVQAGPVVEQLLHAFDAVDYMVVGTFKSPFFIEGGPKGVDPNASFRLNYQTGEGEVNEDVVPFWLVVPKATKQFKPPFNVNIWGHGYTGNFATVLGFAGNMAQHGFATIGINAVNHGLVIPAPLKLLAGGLLANACAGPFLDGITVSRARDLDGDGLGDSGGDFWTSYLFHTRDSVRQSVLDQIQLVRIMRSFGTPGLMRCRTDATGWDQPAAAPCDVNGDGKPDVAGDFNGDGIPDIGGPNATYAAWGESLGGILSGMQGGIDPYVEVAVPGSGGGGLTDVGVRSFQGGVKEAVLLRLWGPLVVSVPAWERPTCMPDPTKHDACTICKPGQASLRWVLPDVNGTGEVEIQCLDAPAVQNTTVFVRNKVNDEVRCARMGEDLRLRVGVPASVGDAIEVSFFDGLDDVTNYGTCEVRADKVGALPRTSVTAWGPGVFPQDSANALPQDQPGYATCTAPSCRLFQGRFFGEGDPLSAPGDGLGYIRQTPSFRRFFELAQAALEPGDPITFAPYYSLKPLPDPDGVPVPPHAVLTHDTIGDMNVPLSAGIAFARATGAVPFLRPEAAAKYPEWANYATPAELYAALDGRTPNQALIDTHVIEGIAPLARHPASAECATSQNARPLDATFTTADGMQTACYATGCMGKPNACFDGQQCDVMSDRCVPIPLGKQTCDEALWDADDLDEGLQLYYEQHSPVPLRLARLARAAAFGGADLSATWQPRIGGAPRSADGGWKPSASPLAALLDSYIVPQGKHSFTPGDPCESFDTGTYLTNVVAQFFLSKGTDLYYLSHPTTHHCMALDVFSCGYLSP